MKASDNIQNSITNSLISHSSAVRQIRDALVRELTSGKKLDREESIDAGKSLSRSE